MYQICCSSGDVVADLLDAQRGSTTKNTHGQMRAEIQKCGETCDNWDGSQHLGKVSSIEIPRYQ